MGGLSIIPNLIPATLIFGLLGILGVALDADTMIIAPVIIGIAVDDTIHFITHYRDEVLKDGDIVRSIRNTIHEVGQAIAFTSLVLGLGFLMLAFSSNTSFIKVGIFGSLAIFAALLSDLFLLPALILAFKPTFSAKTRKHALTAAETFGIINRR
jgi:predicted RND superfamily exporter protein